ncbi:hypothetical protein LAD67_16035 [Escherichia coli]|nr:hypothetical protein [Escherichia coli]
MRQRLLVRQLPAAAVIARRKVNTLILVYTGLELLKQWQERLEVFLQVGDNIGIIGGGKHKPCGNIDIAVVQSISRHGEVETSGQELWANHCG